MSDKKIKLSYFNFKARAELARLILAQAGVDYEDFRIEMEDWPNHKANMPMGQLPVLEFDGQVLSQSLTIARFLAKEFGLAGKTNLDQAQADMVIDTGNDLDNSMYQYMFEKDEERKKTMEEAWKTVSVPGYLKGLEKLLVARGGKHFAGNELTWADIGTAMVLSRLQEKLGENILEPYKHLSDLNDLVNGLPNIKKHIETRPKTNL